MAAPGLIFEVTEQTAVRYLENANASIQALLALGCRSALDDFGRGARALGTQTVAEFVQNGQTVTLLRDLGVDYVQGSYVSLPSEQLPLKRLRAVMPAWRADLGNRKIPETVFPCGLPGIL